MKSEKERRVYYQDLCYRVASVIECFLHKKHGHGVVVVGTADAPSSDLVRAVSALVMEVNSKVASPTTS